MTLRAKALVHGECARCLDPVEREETVEAEWTVKERDLDDPDFDLPLNEKKVIWMWMSGFARSSCSRSQRCCSAAPTARDCVPGAGKKDGGMYLPPAEDEAAPADARLAILKSLLN